MIRTFIIENELAIRKEIECHYNSSLASIYSGLSDCYANGEHFDVALEAINTAIAQAPGIKSFEKETYFKSIPKMDGFTPGKTEIKIPNSKQFFYY